MNKKFFFSTLILTLLLTVYTHTDTTTAKVTSLDNSSAQVILTVPVQPGDYIYEEYITISTDDPSVTVSPYRTTTKPISVYDTSFKQPKSAFGKPFSLSFTMKSDTTLPKKTQLYLSYYAQSSKKIVQDSISIDFPCTEPDVLQTSIETDSPVTSPTSNTQEPATSSEKKQSFFSWSAWTEWAISFVQTTDSWAVRIIFVLLLGLLMSLTPCIYPMIPITVGILQSQGSKSVWYNFLLSLSYTFGIATTFAVLGLVAAFSKQAFGSLMAQPLFVLLVVALLVYLGLSMIGLYDMYIPRMFQPKQKNVKGGSLISAYLFGAASGTFASPCLSPGLFLLLTLVTAWGNKLLGFVLLFVFGIGLSIPLLIIGSFSSSLAFLPRAGVWMVEIKRVFGFIILGVSFYFLQNIISSTLISLLLALFILCVGIFYLYDIKPHEALRWKIIKNILGMTLIASSVFFFVRAYRTKDKESVDKLWEYDYYAALDNAKQENKKLLIDIGAPFCSICKAIDSGLFSRPEVIKQLVLCTTLKIDGSAENEACRTLRDKYSILGFPTILLIDPENGAVIKKWGAELYDLSPEQFISQLESAQEKPKNQ